MNIQKFFQYLKNSVAKFLSDLLNIFTNHEGPESLFKITSKFKFLFLSCESFLNIAIGQCFFASNFEKFASLGLCYPLRTANSFKCLSLNFSMFLVQISPKIEKLFSSFLKMENFWKKLKIFAKIDNFGLNVRFSKDFCKIYLSFPTTLGTLPTDLYAAITL